jgi:hypothetical protein
MIAIDGGTGAGQSRYIVGYTAGRIAYVARHWTVTPDNTSTYVLYADNQVLFIHMGLAQAGAAGSITLQSTASATDDIYNGQLIRITSGTGDDQIRVITDYDGTTKVATVEPNWTVNPDSTSYYGTLQSGIATIAQLETNAQADVRTALGMASANLDTQLSDIDNFLDTEVAAILADTSELQVDWANGGRLDLLVDAIKAKTDNLPASPAATGDIPTVGAIADQVWDEALAGHLGAGSTGDALNDAGAAGDPWGTALPGAYGAGTAGKIVGDNLNAKVGDVEADTQNIQSRIPAALVGGRIDSDVGAISTDATAADNLETMLDGTGGQTLSLGQLNIVASGNNSALVATGAGTGAGIIATGGATGAGLRALGGATSGFGLWAQAQGGNSAGITASGFGVGKDLDVTEINSIKNKTDNLPSDPADQSAVEAAILAAWTTALTESYNADGAAPTPAQALMLIMQRLTEFAISGTTITVKKLDGTTTAATLTLDSPTDPSSSTRAT